MKTLKSILTFCLLNFTLCIYSSAQNNNSNQVQTIRPSAIVQIPKFDVNKIAAIPKAAHENEENEFEEEFRKAHHVTSKVAAPLQNNSGGTTYQTRINPC